MKTFFCVFKQLTLCPTRNFIRNNVLWRCRQQTSRRLMSASAMPIFRKQMGDDSEEEILEEELCNETENLAMRYRKFKILALIDAAVKATGDSAISCVKVLKCIEGQYNKAFLITMNNGAQILTKIPNPNAGPAFYTTASEVATRDFLRTVLDFPILRIYAYSLDPLNPVEAEYIIEEKVEGQPLGTLWHHWSTESKADLVAQLVDLEAKLTSVSFRKHGCIYYKKDLEDRGLPVPNLETAFSSHDGPVQQLDSERYALGPLTEAKLWEGERATMKLDRGPWSTPLFYMAAMGINEIQWAKAHIKPQINVCRSIKMPVSPDDYISLLNRYFQVAPYISPGSFRTSLSHSDLHLDNIFVDPITKKMTGVIDWQSASVSEPFLQHRVSRMLLPVNRRSSEGSDQTVYLLSHYQNLSRLKNEQRWAAVNLHNRTILTEPVSLICGAWIRSDLFSFCHALIHLASRWKEIAPATTSCSIQFTEPELQLHNSELELVEGFGEVLHQLQNDGLIPLGGMVPRERYQQALHVNSIVREMFVDMAQSQSQKALYSRLLPYQD